MRGKILQVLGLLTRPSATLSSIADGGEGRGEEVLSLVESGRSTILGFLVRCSFLHLQIQEKETLLRTPARLRITRLFESPRS